MAIDIEDPEAERLITQLSELTGEELTEAVITAVGETRLEKIRAIADEVAPLLKDMPDHGDYLYDKETGLPK